MQSFNVKIIFQSKDLNFNLEFKTKIVILIVDDNAINQECLKIILLKLNQFYQVEILECDNGEKAVDCFKRNNICFKSNNI